MICSQTGCHSLRRHLLPHQSKLNRVSQMERFPRLSYQVITHGDEAGSEVLVVHQAVLPLPKNTQNKGAENQRQDEQLYLTREPKSSRRDTGLCQRSKGHQWLTKRTDPTQEHQKIISCKFPLWLSGLRTQLTSMRMWVRSLALFSGLRIGRCRELWCLDLCCFGCGVDLQLWFDC